MEISNKIPLSSSEAIKTAMSAQQPSDIVPRSERKRWKYKIRMDHKKLKRAEERKRRRKRLADGRSSFAQVAEIKEPVDSGLRVLIDLRFVDLMNSKERRRLASQLGRIWGVQKAAPKPVALMLCGLADKTDFVKECSEMCTGFESYKWLRDERSVEELFSAENLVYLCPDNDCDPLVDLNEEKVLVIGGLVDESGKGAVSKERARALGAQVSRLPVAEFMQRSSTGTFNLMLPINQVFEIVVRTYGSGDWSQSLAAVLPRRIGYVPRQQPST